MYELPFERREYNRLPLRWPVETVITETLFTTIYRAVSSNICPAGVYFDTDVGKFTIGQTVALVLMVPAGNGYSPFVGKAQGVAKITRVELLQDPDRTAKSRPRYGVAAHFSKTLSLSF